VHIRGACFHSFQTNGQIGQTCVGPQKLRWPRAPRSLNPYLVIAYNELKIDFMRRQELDFGGLDCEFGGSSRLLPLLLNGVITFFNNLV